MNDKFKKQLKEAILEVLISKLDEQGPQGYEGTGAKKLVDTPKFKYLPGESKPMTKPEIRIPAAGSMAATLATLAMDKKSLEKVSKYLPDITKRPEGSWTPETDTEYQKLKSKKSWEKAGGASKLPSTAKAAEKTTSTSTKPAPAAITKAASRAAPKPQPSPKRQPKKIPKMPKIDLGSSDKEAIDAPPDYRAIMKKKIGKPKPTTPTSRVNRTRYK